MITALQSTKLGLFLLINAFLVLGAVFSRLVILILSTSITGNDDSTDIFNRKCSRFLVAEIVKIGLQYAIDIRCHLFFIVTFLHRTPKLVASLYVGLFLIQCLPDLLHIFCNASTFFRRQGGRVIPSLVVLESVRSFGLCLLEFLVFPQLDVHRCILLFACFPMVVLIQNCFASLAATLNPSLPFCARFGRSIMLSPYILLMLVVLSSTYLWAVLDTPLNHWVLMPIALFSVSVGFWESWIGVQHAGTAFDNLYRLKYAVRKVSSSTRWLVAMCRVVICLSILVVAVIEHKHKGLNLTHFFTVLVDFNLKKHHSGRVLLLCVCLCIVHLLLRRCARFLAAIDMRPLSLFHPIVTSSLLSYAVVSFICSTPHCFLAKILSHFSLQLVCSQWPVPPSPFEFYIGLVWLAVGSYRGFCYVKQRYFNIHEEINFNDYRISSMPAHSNGFAIEQSLAVFQTAVTKQNCFVSKEEYVAEMDDELRIRNAEVDRTLTMYVCATMWHETEEEMSQMLSSILKLDAEQSLRMNSRKANELRFKMEGHIFFDDAWEDEQLDGGGQKRVPNPFFKTFFQLVNQMTGESLPEEDDCLETRVLVGTPYGGRLVVRLPAGTLLFVHLKDKQLIRHTKSWSQVMYMYYLLGHRIMDSPLSLEDRQQMADNTFILALDGDSKFEPEAALRLLQLMKQKSDIGCACGRIHPIGRGIMGWYQKFEYAIAHWFQKAAEHVFGSVLCAPGCFSLFRASALMDDNIMHKYTKTASLPRHFVQYDQGEDRWLSTLLLKQGYRIEYAAASDAETYAPEGFEEFFNQRRRWTPSSIANTIDLLADYKRALSNNSSISSAYIFYQFIVIFFSMLGPAIIFSMLVFSQVVAAFGVDSSRVVWWNGVPISLFIASCFLFESNFQLTFAKVMSLVYAFVMLAVLVATSSQIVLETVISPTSMFIVTMVLIFFTAACMHPREFTNIIYGCVFFLMIPSTYVFLSLYSLINLNVINWGTREAVAKATGQAKPKSPLEMWMEKINSSKPARLCSRMLCRVIQEENKMEKIEKKIDHINQQISDIKANPTREERDRLIEEGEGMEVKGNEEETRVEEELVEIEQKKEDGQGQADGGVEQAGQIEKMKRRSKYAWMDCDYLKVCERGKLKDAENTFWKQLIEAYLKKHKDVLSIKWVPYRMIIHRLNTMIGAFQDVKQWTQMGTAKGADSKEDDERLLNAGPHF
ncbi:hypothetical protein WR25_00350 [Diploscapter pachys]|uniref:chitin synthase n=1 Tax=Diploscapter pachys TaxID=2018661 RepID=A0A2A2L5V4_9BILA|nr:hypothetical protein WR25_00350 [Diploscapter pachys]